MSNLIINICLGHEKHVKHFNVYDFIVLLRYSFLKNLYSATYTPEWVNYKPNLILKLGYLHNDF